MDLSPLLTLINAAIAAQANLPKNTSKDDDPKGTPDPKDSPKDPKDSPDPKDQDPWADLNALLERNKIEPPKIPTAPVVQQE